MYSDGKQSAERENSIALQFVEKSWYSKNFSYNLNRSSTVDPQSYVAEIKHRPPRMVLGWDTTLVQTFPHMLRIDHVASNH